MTGVFALKTSHDLLRKLEHDFERLSKDPDDSYAAFDFFVTAHHLPEWMFPGDKRRADDLRAGNKWLRLVRDIGDGAKHFALTWRPPEDVHDTSVMESRYGLSAFGVGRYSQGVLLINLSEETAVEFGCSVLDARGVASEVLGLYRAQLDAMKQP